MNFDLLILALLFGLCSDSAKRDGKTILSICQALVSIGCAIGFAVTEAFQ